MFVYIFDDFLFYFLIKFLVFISYLFFSLFLRFNPFKIFFRWFLDGYLYVTILNFLLNDNEKQKKRIVLLYVHTN